VWASLMNSTLGAGDPDLNPDGVEHVVDREVPEIFARCGKMIAERRANPTDDLTSVLVHAEVDGERLEEHEIVMGFFLLMAAGNDSTKATYCSGMRALLENPAEHQKVLDDPSLVPSLVEESLRMFPAFAHFRRTATRDTELGGQKIREGDKVVMWYVSSNRDKTRYEDPERFDVARNPEHQAFGAGGRHFCLGTALARLELRILFEESLRMFPAFAHFRRTATRDTELDGQKIREGDKVVMWYVSSNRDETVYEDADRFDVTRNPEHQAFGAGGRHFCLGTALARLELTILFEETLARYPNMELAGKPMVVESPFLNQLKTLPVRLSP